MSLPHAILTALAERSCSGSELARRFDRSIGYFWQATHQQIYRELARLEKKVWIAAVEPDESSGPVRRYKLLPAGREALRQWVGQDLAPEPMRSEVLLRLRAEAVLGPSGFEQELARQIPLYEATLAVYQDIEARDFLPALSQSPSRQLKLQHAVLRAGILRQHMYLAWAKETLALLRES